MRFFDRFCTRFPRFGVPHLIRLIVFGTGLVYIATHVANTPQLAMSLFFDSHAVMAGQVWRLFSFLIVPTQSNPIWFAVSLYVTYIFGTSLERAWGQAKFTLYILSNIIVLAGAGMVVHFAAPLFSHSTGLFVSGYFLQSFLLFAFIALASDSTINLNFILPIRAGIVGILMGGALIYDLFFGPIFPLVFPLNFLPFVLLIPFLLFCGGALFGRSGTIRPTSGTKAAINFHRAKKKVEQKQQERAYTRKCEVCGKTDTDYPDMEFRYCSRCNGYHCYCMDHINNHEHVK